jgi:hypothetical protein
MMRDYESFSCNFHEPSCKNSGGNTSKDTGISILTPKVGLINMSVNIQESQTFLANALQPMRFGTLRAEVCVNRHHVTMYIFHLEEHLIIYLPSLHDDIT